MKVSVNPAVKTQLLTVVAVSKGISFEQAQNLYSDSIDRCIQNLELVEMGKCGIDEVLADPDSHIIVLAKMIFQGMSMADAAISILVGVKHSTGEGSNAPLEPIDVRY